MKTVTPRFCGAAPRPYRKPTRSPAGTHLQLLHTPADALYVPRGQPEPAGAAVVLPGSHRKPSLQGPLHSAVVAAVVLPNRPAGQSWQLLAPLELHCPAGHGPPQVGPVAPGAPPANPAVQLAQDNAPAALHRPTGHTSAPGAGEPDAGLHAYPAVQLVQATAPENAYWPAGHAAPGGDPDVEPAEHANPGLHTASHAAELVPGAVPKRPAEQFVHVPAPGRLYWPAGHTACALEPAGQKYPAVQTLVQGVDLAGVLP